MSTSRRPEAVYRYARRFERLEDLTKREHLESVLGAIRSVDIQPLDTKGFSGCRLQILSTVLDDGTSKRFILKFIPLKTDWTCRLSGATRCREAALLAAQSLSGVWSIFSSPYIAYAENEAESALLMEDLTSHLLPDVRKPLEEEEESSLVITLARLHAFYWHSTELEDPWLARLSSFWSILGPDLRGDAIASQRLAPRMYEALVRGWTIALRSLPAGVVKILSTRAEEAEQRWAHLPWTLVHGDVKVANFVLRPDGGVSAFDWALVGRAPVSVDLGWYLAVNATRLTGTKESFLDRWRQTLESALGEKLPDGQWQEITTAALIIGARMLLWSKAVALDSGNASARAEWEWWVSRLEEACRIF